ncbi:hypothetical protein EDD21DRAFT_415409 [Dissophora ornata]|nr:hypothetical protein EDD21DRAFT_415409 [Dissophora ornata]
MALFKSSKNQSASAATTPRSSMNEQRRAQVTKLTQDQVLEMLHKKAMPNPSSATLATNQHTLPSIQSTIQRSVSQNNTLLNTNNMALFKSSKNQSASAATTPRSSMNEQRSVQVTKMTPDQVLEMLHKKAMPNSYAGPSLR